MNNSRPIAVTGASGYIGGRLVPRLLEAGYHVRCLVRDPGKLLHRHWADDPRVEIVRCDLDDGRHTQEALQGCEAAFYLVHSMMVAGKDYAGRDRELARSFSRAAAAARVERIIYLGGLGETGADLSKHLSSRREVETELAADGVPLTTLRAAMIIGSGSASFEILRYLVERLPVMVTPVWVRTRCQPIAVRNVLHYLIACLEEPRTIGQTLDIGGPQTTDYAELMQIMANVRGLPRRRILTLPVLTPRLSSLWIHLVTPLSRNIARPLAEGLRNEVVCRDDRAARWMPQRLLDVEEAIRAGEQVPQVETCWSDAGVIPGDPDWAGGTTFEDRREIDVEAPASALFGAVCRVGGGHGWYAADWLWRLRGWMDRLVGGPGLRRGRRDPSEVAYGDALDFWRVTSVEQDRRLGLLAEMKLPGEATLEFEIIHREGGSRLRQVARFRPRGLLGICYWYAVLPLHSVVFSGMLRGIRRAAEAQVVRPESRSLRIADKVSSTQATSAKPATTKAAE